MIETIRAAKYPVSYKDVADQVTRANYNDILAEAERRAPRTGKRVKNIFKGKNGTINVNGELTENQFRAIENYRRRIYDAWSVLRASNIIEKVGKDYFRYNRDVLEAGHGAPEEASEPGKVTITAEKLSKILQSINTIRSDMWENGADKKATRRPHEGLDDQEEIMNIINATQEKCSQMYDNLKDKLSDFHEAKTSTGALKRLIKRNRKREEQLERALKESQPRSRRDLEEDRRIKMPYVIARYEPMPEAIPARKRGRDFGLESRRASLKMASRRPIQAMDDRACLKYLDLAESDEEVSDDSLTENQASVSERFYKRSDEKKQKMRESGENRLVDERLIELLEKLPKNKRISLRA